MSKPIEVKYLGPDALSQLETAVENAINAAQASPQPFLTGEVAIPALIATQLPVQASSTGFLLRVEGNVYVNSSSGPTGGMILYEGDDIRFENVTDLSQVWVTTLKNSPTVLRWMTL